MGIEMKVVVKESGLDDIVERLKHAYDPERIYLFGSRARGDEGPDSDFDFLVVVPDDASRERRGSRLAYQALRGREWLRTSWCGPAPTSTAAAI